MMTTTSLPAAIESFARDLECLCQAFGVWCIEPTVEDGAPEFHFEDGVLTLLDYEDGVLRVHFERPGTPRRAHVEGADVP